MARSLYQAISSTTLSAESLPEVILTPSLSKISTSTLNPTPATTLDGGGVENEIFAAGAVENK